MKRIRLLVFALLLVTLTLSLGIAAAATSGDYTYTTATDSNGTTSARITKYNGTGGNVVVPDTLGGYPVTSIGDYAFRNCTSLSSINLPDSVTSIGGQAFYGCTSLSSIDLPDRLTSIGSSAFSGCTLLSSVDLPAGVTSIGNNAFSGCTSLSSIDLPDSVTSIGSNAFNYNTRIPCAIGSSLAKLVSKSNHDFTASDFSLRYLFDTNGNEAGLQLKGYIGTEAAVRVPDSVTTIDTAAFSGCTSLSSIDLPDKVTSIGYATFYGCTSLSSIDLPHSLTSIGNSAFEGCTSLSSIALPHSLTSIGNSAFEGCTSLSSIALPDKVTSIGNAAFAGCTSLSSIALPDSVTSLGSSAFASNTRIPCAIGSSQAKLVSKSKHDFTASDFTLRYLFDTNGNEAGLRLTGYIGTEAAVRVPAGVTEIGGSAFSGCTSLLSINLPDSVTTIGAAAFYGCTSLSSIDLPDSVTSIGSSAFSGCTSLSSIDLPASVTSIGSYAFASNTRIPCAIGSSQAKLVSKSGYHFTVSDFTLCYLFDTNGNEAGLRLTGYIGTEAAVRAPAGVTEIGSSAFEGCTTLSSINLPDSVTSIGDRAFYVCTTLSSIDLLGSVTSIGSSAFSGCTTLSSIDLPDSVTSIGNSAFYRCTSLSSIDLPAGVTSIGYQAFYGCTSLSSIDLPAGVTSIGYATFYRCTSLSSIDLPAGVTSIGNSAFEGCTSLSSVDLPAGMTSIGINAFYGCTSLSSIDLPDSLTSIGGSAFAYSTRIPCAIGSSLAKLVSKSSHDFLANDFTLRYLFDTNGNEAGFQLTGYLGTEAAVRVPAGVTSIGDRAFYGCTLLSSIDLPDGVTTIGSYAFSGCTSLSSIDLPDSVTSIGDDAFRDCTLLSSIDLLDNVTSIGSYAFLNCTSLSSIDLPDNLTSIGSSAFESCTSLSSINLPDSVTSIGNSAFEGCTSLSSVDLPAGMTSIGINAFSGCTSLSSIDLPDSVTSIGSSAFASNTRIPCAIGSSLAKLVSKSNHDFTASDFSLRYLFDTNGNEAGLQLKGYIGVAATARVPDGVTEIGKYALCYDTIIHSLTLPESIRIIGENALPSYDNVLQSLVLPYAALTIESQRIPATATLYCYQCTAGETRARQMAAEYGCKVVLLDGKTPLDYVKMSFPKTAVINLGMPFDAKNLLNVTPYPVDGLAMDWVSSNTSVATVDANGLVTPITTGQTKLTATAHDYPTLTASVQLTIKKAIVSFDLPDELWLPTHVSEPVTVLNLTPADAPLSLTWSIENELVATVSSSGVVSTISLGETTLTAVSDSGVKRTCKVKVFAPVSAVTMEPAALELYQHETRQVTATAKAGAVTVVNHLVTFSSDNPAVATVDQQGNVTGVSVGQTDIRATSATGKTAACHVTVVDMSTLQLPTATITIEAYAFEGAAMQLVIIPNNCTTIGDGAFRSCANLQRVIIPDTVHTIGEHAFDDCPNVVFYCSSSSPAKRYADAHGIPTVNP